MNRSALLATIICVAMAVGALGCGDDADTTGTSTKGASTATGTTASGAPPTKAEFIQRADEICEGTDKKQEADLKAYLRKEPEPQSSKAGQEDAIRVAGLPPIRVEVEELGALPAPAGDEAEVEAIVDGIEGALEQSEGDPGSLLSKASESPFLAVGKLASKYGFKACNNAF